MAHLHRKIKKGRPYYYIREIKRVDGKPKGVSRPHRHTNTRSKRAPPGWSRGTAISEIRPVPIEELSSQRYWEKWDRVSPDAVEAIGKEFFARLWSMQPAPPECLPFDTTPYYTYMSTPTA